jgi:C-terminal processing protease CtpA/Prc
LAMRHSLKAVLAAALCPGLLWAQERGSADRAFDEFWNATSVKGAEKAAEGIMEIQEPADFGLRVDSRRADGRKIIDIIEGTTSAEMGLKKGDTIVRMDEAMIRTAGDIGRAFDEHAAGTPMVFEVDRKGQRLTMQGIFPHPNRPANRRPSSTPDRRAG